MGREPTDEPLSTGRRLLIYFGLADAPGPRSRADRTRDGIQIGVAIALIVIVLTGARGSAISAAIVGGVIVLLSTAAWSAVDRRRSLRSGRTVVAADADPEAGLDLRERARRAAAASRAERERQRRGKPRAERDAPDDTDNAER